MSKAVTQVQVKAKTAPTLGKVEADARQGVQAMQERTKKAGEQTSRLQEISGQLEQAIKARDFDRVQALQGDFESARKSYESNRRDLATAMVGIVAGMKDIGLSLQALQDFSPEEQSVIDSAEKMVTEAEVELESAKVAWFSKATKIAAANARIKTAQSGVESAKQLAEQKKRQRLENMKLEQSLQLLQTMTTQAAQITRDGITEMEENLEVMQAGGVQLMEDLQQLSRDIEQADQSIAGFSAELSTLREQQQELQQNSPEWIELKTRITEKERELSQKETERNQAFALYQDSQRFVEQYRVQETGQREALSFSQSWIALLESGVAHRTEVFQSHLGLIKSAGNMQAMEMIDAVATETDERVLGDAVNFSAAARNRMMARLQRAPSDLNRLRDLTKVNEESRAIFEKKLGDLLGQFHNNWGSDPTYDDRAKQPVDEGTRVTQ